MALRIKLQEKTANDAVSAPRGATAIDRHVGQRLRNRRQVHGLSQAALAEILGIAPQQLHKYEIGENRLSVSRLYQLCLVLNVGIAWFFDGLPGASPPTAAVDDTQRLLTAWSNFKDDNTRRILVELAEHMDRQGRG
ncbi:MAG: helix-turn-helix transcriptional regulator [Proteobacteria bacterium]|nr:helix-turn-helix transcriptional regulator [Pseudomonadota bacterium]